jgi:hypothetical protein
MFRIAGAAALETGSLVEAQRKALVLVAVFVGSQQVVGSPDLDGSGAHTHSLRNFGDRQHARFAQAIVARLETGRPLDRICSPCPVSP